MISWRRALGWLTLPLELTTAFSLWLVSWRSEVRGFTIGFLLAEKPQRDDVAKLIMALDYVCEHSASHWKMLTRYVKRIAVMNRPRASYIHLYRSILLPAQGLREWHPSQVASLLVHEATHARIRSRKVHTGERSYSRQRVEAVCIRSQIRFAKKIGPAAVAMRDHLERQLDALQPAPGLDDD